METVGVIGAGEVGKAVSQLLAKKYVVKKRDLSFDEIATPVDYLHICIPYSQKFSQIVIAAIAELRPQLTVIHSTIKPGTTESIYQQTKNLLVHSPFLGVHPTKPDGQFIHGEGKDLYDYFEKFPKMIGPTSPQSAQLAQKHFQAVGLKVAIFDSSKETEMAKILSTTYYGWNIIFEKWVHQVCQNEGANFDQLYTQYNTYYNQGYQETLPHVVRPVLKHHHGVIGGHCVIPNALIIHQWLDDAFTQFLLDQNQKLAQKEA